MFSCKYCKIFKNSFFIEYLRWLLLYYALEGNLSDEKNYIFEKIIIQLNKTKKAPINIYKQYSRLFTKSTLIYIFLFLFYSCYFYIFSINNFLRRPSNVFIAGFNMFHLLKPMNEIKDTCTVFVSTTFNRMVNLPVRWVFHHILTKRRS